MKTKNLVLGIIIVTLISPTFYAGAQSEDYEAVDPSELRFGIVGFSGVTEIGEGGVRIMKEGTFEKLLFEGKEMGVVTTEIKDGFIETNDYGNIKISVAGFGGFTLYLTPSQKTKLLQLKEKYRQATANKKSAL